MTGLLHSRTMTAALVLWSGYVVAWMVIVGSSVAIAVLWWLVGVILFGSLWLATQPRPGRDVASTASSAGPARRTGT
jgi:hypothetical protein